MPDGRPAIFDEIVRIEQQAEKILADARAQAKMLRLATEEQVRALAEETERTIEQKKAELAEQYKVKTAQVLAQIDGEFLRAEEALKAAQEGRFNDLVEHALSALRLSLLHDTGVQAGGET